MSGNIGVEPLQLLAKLRDIFISCSLGRGQLCLQCSLLRRLPLLNGMPSVERSATDDNCHDNQ